MAYRERRKTQLCSYLILKVEDNILWSKRKDTGYYDGYFSLPAGRVELNESIEHCIIREAEEEIGITIHEYELKLVHVMHRFETDGESMDCYFTTGKYKGTIENKEPNKCSELKWFNVNSPRDDRIPYVYRCVNNSLVGMTYSEIRNIAHICQA